MYSSNPFNLLTYSLVGFQIMLKSFEISEKAFHSESPMVSQFYQQTYNNYEVVIVITNKIRHTTPNTRQARIAWQIYYLTYATTLSNLFTEI